MVVVVVMGGEVVYGTVPVGMVAGVFRVDECSGRAGDGR